MSLFSQPPRLFSNKENSTITPLHHLATTSSSASTAGNGPHKHRVAGIGIAPKRRLHHQTPKPYARAASVQRAKETANKRPKRRPLPLQLSSTTAAWSGPRPAQKATQKTSPRATQQTRQQLRTAGSVAPAQTSKSSPTASAPEITIPIALPRVEFPPVRPFPTGHNDYMPAEYAVAKLLPAMNRLYIASALYRPRTSSPYHPHPSSNDHRADHGMTGNVSAKDDTPALAAPSLCFGTSSDGRVTLPFALPATTSARARANCAGHEPDVCLYVTRNGEGVGRAVPASEMVYRSQCSYWKGSADINDGRGRDNVPDTNDEAQTSDADGVEDGSSDSGSAASTETLALSTPTIHATSTSTSNSTSTSPTTTRTTNSNSDSNSDLGSDSNSDAPMPLVHTPSHPSRPSGDRHPLDLPLIHLPLPSPETFNVIHQHLHFPLAPLHPLLLDLPMTSVSLSESTAGDGYGHDHARQNEHHRHHGYGNGYEAGRQHAQAHPHAPGSEYATHLRRRLGSLSQAQLVARLERIHGVWRNLCALGMGRTKTWTQLGEAWGWCVDALLAQGMRVAPPKPGCVPPAGFASS